MEIETVPHYIAHGFPCGETHGWGNILMEQLVFGTEASDSPRAKWDADAPASLSLSLANPFWEQLGAFFFAK